MGFGTAREWSPTLQAGCLDGFDSHILHYGHVVLDAVTVENPQGCLEFDSPHVHLSTNSNFKEDGLDCKSKILCA